MVNKLFYSYLAGFIDADGSIYVQLKRNETYKFGFQISPSVVFFQKEATGLKIIHKKLALGYLRKRKDGLTELIIGDKKSIEKLLVNILPFLILKNGQAQLMLDILEEMKSVDTAQSFLEISKKIDGFKKLNYSKRRTVNARVVSNYLKNLGLLTP
jgi:intein-encoded DNA endonuclease-like protein